MKRLHLPRLGLEALVAGCGGDSPDFGDQSAAGNTFLAQAVLADRQRSADETRVETSISGVAGQRATNAKITACAVLDGARPRQVGHTRSDDASRYTLTLQTVQGRVVLEMQGGTCVG